MKRIITFAAVMAVALSAVAQELYWGVDFATIFDNREGDDKYEAAKTYFQTRLAPEIGVSFEDSVHRLAGGVVWTQPIGAHWDGYRLSPTLYYRYKKGPLKGALGMFGRDELYRPLPDYIWNDSSYYCQRNIRGAMLQWADARGYAEAILDWRGMQSDTRREAFNIIVSGERQYKGGRLMWGGTAMMNHLAKARHRDDQFVVDNFLINPYVGTNLAGGPLPGLDSCTVHVGLLASATRDRGDRSGWQSPKWRTAGGFWLDIGVAWKWLRVREELYAGGKLFPIYERYGALLDQGEAFYSSPWYNRTSVAAVLLSRSFVDLRASLDFNFARDSFIFYQRLILRMKF